ncbi:hypothetical protein MSAN_02474600 [Mycena sanguinolenta]|uniref:Uncharacterized protein n=1 Tax=Mycena sanguinolenta TaxID=230812 RepID=A0A8H6U2C1_9AGAR|nr:hypothetical protein MSAN_02474600 [Mycena sanguinolenta]
MSEKIGKSDDTSSGQGIDRKVTLSSSVYDAESQDLDVSLGQPGESLKLDKTGLPSDSSTFARCIRSFELSTVAEDCDTASGQFPRRSRTPESGHDQSWWLLCRLQPTSMYLLSLLATRRQSR